MTFDFSSEEGLKKANEFLETNNYFSGENMPNEKDVEALNNIKETPCNKKYPNLFGYVFDFLFFMPEAKELWTKKQETNQKKNKGGNKKKEVKKDDEEDFDLFGEDPDLEEKAKKVKEAQKKEEKKKVVVFKSRVVFDVKGYEIGQDFEGLCKKIKEQVNFKGLEWMNDQKILPVGFGMKKLQMVMRIEDEVSSDEVLEKIMELFEDDVQSCDVVDFQKA